MVTKFTGKQLCQSLFLIKLQVSACNFIKKETLAQVFSCELREVSINTFSYKTPQVAASILTKSVEKWNELVIVSVSDHSLIKTEIFYDKINVLDIMLVYKSLFSCL